jgi:hypothetical protein
VDLDSLQFITAHTSVFSFSFVFTSPLVIADVVRKKKKIAKKLKHSLFLFKVIYTNLNTFAKLEISQSEVRSHIATSINILEHLQMGSSD